MATFDWTRALIIQLSILASIVLVVIAWHVVTAITHTVLVFAIAAILAFILAPLVERTTAAGVPRPAAVAITYLGLAVCLVLGGLLVSRPFVAQATLLLENWPAYVANAQSMMEQLDQRLEAFGLGGTLHAAQAELARVVGAGGSFLLVDSLRIIQQLAGSVVDTIIVIVTSFYLLLVGPRVRSALVELTPAPHRSKVAFVEESLVRVLGGYLRGQLLLAVSLGIVVTLGLQLLGMPYAIVLGVLAGLFELVPMFGPVLGALPALGVALLQPYPLVLWVLIFFIVVQQIENHILVPRISGHAVGLHPLGAILALLAGLELGGLLGAVFAVPVVGFLWVLAGEVYRRTIASPPTAAPSPGWRFRTPNWRFGRPVAPAAPADSAPNLEPERAPSGSLAASPEPIPPAPRPAPRSEQP